MAPPNHPQAAEGANRGENRSALPNPSWERLLDDFRNRSGALGVRVELASDSDQLCDAVLKIADEWGTNAVVIAPRVAVAFAGLPGAIQASGRAACISRGADGARDAPLGISLATMALAETGSVLLDERTLDDRAVSMLALNQIVICPSNRLAEGLHDAAPVLRIIALEPGGGYATLVTGPSRTADIERALTVGVQGPARVAVIFFGDC